MKIGILSMQGVANYGSFLQAYALKSILESFGNECTFIRPERDLEIPAMKRPAGFYLKKVRERLLARDMLLRVYYLWAFHKKFRLFREELSGEDNGNVAWDLAVIGSDEVFNCLQSAPWCFSSRLFGNIPGAGKVISYAASFGHTTYDGIVGCGIEGIVAKALANLSAVSVRDTHSHDMIRRLTGKDARMHVDPVLIYDYGKLIPDDVPEKDYILIYSYPGRIRNSTEIAAIRAFARNKGKKLISVGFYFSWCDKTVIPHPFDVMAYFKKADYVITDTFHGTIMSIKFNKRFCTIIRDTNTQKLTSLLKQFGLEDRVVEAGVRNLSGVLDKPVDYTAVNTAIGVEKERTMAYLEKESAAVSQERS